MESRATPAFWRSFGQLPADVQVRARIAYRTFASDPSYPGLRFKRVSASLPLWSARVSQEYRAVGQRRGGLIVWFWIGTHAEYDRLLRSAS